VSPRKYLPDRLVLAHSAGSVPEVAKSCPGVALNKLVAYKGRMNDLTAAAY
jgi:hypothetical protein